MTFYDYFNILSLSSEVVWRKSSASLAVIILSHHTVNFSRTKKTGLNLAWPLIYLVCYLLLYGIIFETCPWHGCLFLVSVVFCRLHFSASGRSLAQRSLIEYSLNECDREASIMCRPWPTRGRSRPLGGK